MQSTRDRPPWLLKFRSSTVFIIATVWISSFTDYFLYAMVVPILPTALSERANVPYEDREKWVSILLMCEAATAFLCCPIFGYIVDVAPTRRLPFVLGLIFLGASMGLLAAARSTTVFVLARLMQGGATAMVAVAGLALLTDSVPLDNLGQTIGYQGSAVALGFLLGPLLGGIVYEKAGYGAVFGMAFALVGVDLVMRVFVVEKRVAARWVDEDGAGPGNDTVSVSEPGSGSGSGAESSLLGSSASTICPNTGYQTFAEAETGTRIEPPPDTNQQTHIHAHDENEHGQGSPTIFQIAKQPRVVISSFGLLVQGLLFSAFDATIPIFVETTFKWTPLGAGLAFLPSALTALLEPFFGYLADKHGTRIVTFNSFILLPIPLFALSYVSNNTPAHISLLLTLLTLIGLLINLAMPALFVETQGVLDAMNNPTGMNNNDNTNTNRNQNHNHIGTRDNTNQDPIPTPPPINNKSPKAAGIAQAFGIQTMAQFLGMFLGSLWGGLVEWRFGWAVMGYSLAGLCFVASWGMLFLGEPADFRWFGKGRGDEIGNGDGDEESGIGERERLISSSRE
ncbi:major facilitator superfamily domain-containing protein [Aspergillus californicus]